MTVDSILNVAIPIGILIAFLGLFYWKMKEPVDMVLAWLGRGLGKAFDEVASSLSGKSITEVTYK